MILGDEIEDGGRAVKTLFKNIGCCTTHWPQKYLWHHL